MRWQPLLAEIRAQKLALARLDPRAGMPVQPPPGASPAAIAAAERRLGQPLPRATAPCSRSTTACPASTRGRPCSATRPLARGTYVDLARMTIDAERSATLFPFGIDATGETIFAWDTAHARPDGELEVVVWMNEIGARIDGFPAFLELVLDMLAADIAERQRAEARRMRPFSSWAAA